MHYIRAKKVSIYPILLKFLFPILSNSITEPCFLIGKDFGGRNLLTAKKDSAKECQNFCQDHDECDQFSYITEAYNGEHGIIQRKTCILKSKADTVLVDVADIISGPKNCPR